MAPVKKQPAPRETLWERSTRGSSQELGAGTIGKKKKKKKKPTNQEKAKNKTLRIAKTQRWD